MDTTGKIINVLSGVAELLGAFELGRVGCLCEEFVLTRGLLEVAGRDDELMEDVRSEYALGWALKLFLDWDRSFLADLDLC